MIQRTAPAGNSTLMWWIQKQAAYHFTAAAMTSEYEACPLTGGQLCAVPQLNLASAIHKRSAGKSMPPLLCLVRTVLTSLRRFPRARRPCSRPPPPALIPYSAWNVQVDSNPKRQLNHRSASATCVWYSPEVHPSFTSPTTAPTP